MCRLTRSLWPADTSVPVAETTVGELLRDTAARAPDELALVAGVGDPAARRRWTYAELVADADAVAGVLLEHLEPGERLGVWAPNVPEWQVVQFGAALAGITVVSLNPAYTEVEASYALGQSRCAAVVAAGDVRGRDFRRLVASVRGDLPALRHILDFEPGSELWAGVPGGARPEVTPASPAMIQYTSGTTGFPKGAILAHRGMVNNARLFARRFGIAAGSVWLNPLPMFHVGGCGFGALGAMWNRSAHVVTGFEPGLSLELIEAERAAFFPGVPTMLIAMMEHPRFPDTDLSSLEVVMSGGTTVPPELVGRVEKEFGARFGAIFGQTEMGGVMCQSLPGDSLADKSARVGRPLERTEMKVVSPVSGEVVPCGEVGEFHVRGIGQFSGYFDRPEDTAKALDADGWFRTGDLGTMDDRGYVAVTGRLKDMIIRGGENIYPREIEDLLHTVPGIAEAAVVGMPDEYWGEQVAAVVRPAPGVEPDPAAWRAAVRERLSGQKAPRRWFLTDAMPLTAGGKVRKFRLVELIGEGALSEVDAGG
ncbi:AMP-binding protein [Pseudonocardia eucalypti]|uniref:AMP-binding protein n=1 Tax=Pseudonocardia eucalypti TaxID=648755 RepID=A0ABP9PS51_9PSEU|nr:fatty-acyl-CoA synthase [Pseudonocardia eucalypti]